MHLHQRRPLLATLSTLTLAFPLAAVIAIPAVAAPVSAITINEVVHDGDATDWVELINVGTTPVDVSGWVLTDNLDDRTLMLVSGTRILPGAFLSVDVNADELGDAGFGRGSADAIRLYSPDGVTLVDSFAWTNHTLTSYGRCPDGVGEFGDTVASTKGAANKCAQHRTPDIRVNEVESSGGVPGDCIELFNRDAVDVDLSGYIVRDDNDSHVAVLAAGSIITRGGFLVVEASQLGFGLGSDDSARLFLPDGFTVVDQRSWVGHAATTDGVCGNDFTTTSSPTKGAANNCTAPIRLNEIESEGEIPGDWVELVNTGSSDWDISGYSIRDSDDSHTYQVPVDTIIAADGYYVADVDAAFGLGKTDTARLFAVDTSVLIDSYSWTEHAATSYGRCVDGRGEFATSAEPTKGSRNSCAGDLLTSVWPGGSDVTTVDSAGYFGGNLNGLAVEPTTTGDVLWASKNGVGSLYRLFTNGSTVTPANTGGWANGKLLHYSDGIGDVDAEGVAPTGAGASDAGFIDQSTGSTYDPSRYGAHADGLFFVGLEANGVVYAYSLDQSTGEYTRVATVPSGFSSVMDLEFDAERGGLWAVCDDTCDGRSALLTITDSGSFAVKTVFDRPSRMSNLNNEGFALSSAERCVDGSKPAYWADDNNTDEHSLRVGTIRCLALPTRADPTSPSLDAVAAGSRSSRAELALTGIEPVGFIGLAVLFSATGTLLVWLQRRRATESS